MSNTWALERRGWSGACIEGAPEYVRKLRAVRSCTVLHAVVDGAERNATFLLARGYGGLVGRGLDNFGVNPRGEAAPPRAANVSTRTLGALLAAARAPRVVDYLSLDVEGAEERALTDASLAAHTFLTLTIERPSPRLNARLFVHGYLFVANVDFDGHYVHRDHPRAAALQRNGSFEQLPAKCTPHSPRRIGWLYAAALGEYPRRCNNAGYFTIYSDRPGYKGACCYHRGCGAADADCTSLRYGPPTSRHALPAPTTAANTSAPANRTAATRRQERRQFVRATRPARASGRAAGA